MRISLEKLTRVATIRTRWSVLSQAEIIEALRKFENCEVDNKKYAITARLFKVPVGNLSRWWKSREAILKRADDLRERMLLGIHQRQHSQKNCKLHKPVLKMMLALGYTSRRRSKIRPTSVEA